MSVRKKTLADDQYAKALELIDQLRKERDELQTKLSECQKWTDGRCDQLAAQRTEQYRIANERLEAKCAEMRHVLEQFDWEDACVEAFPSMRDWEHALSTDCGKNFLSSKERLEIQCCAEQALAHLGDSGNGSRHDPSWIRPMKMTREEITASCIQAYHQIHRILEILAAHKPS